MHVNLCSWWHEIERWRNIIGIQKEDLPYESTGRKVIHSIPLKMPEKSPDSLPRPKDQLYFINTFFIFIEQLLFNKMGFGCFSQCNRLCLFARSKRTDFAGEQLFVRYWYIYSKFDFVSVFWKITFKSLLALLNIKDM